jgi:hypothetical protein
MPRKRDPNKPIKLRTKLEDAAEINAELRRTYRLFVNKDITHAEMSRRRELLVALRAGLPESVERRKDDSYSFPDIRIFSVPSGCFLKEQQIEAAKRGEPFVDPKQCAPLRFDTPPLIEHAPSSEPASAPNSRLTALEAELIEEMKSNRRRQRKRGA